MSLGERWLLSANLAVTELAGSAADSPLTERTTNTALALSVLYRF